MDMAGEGEQFDARQRAEVAAALAQWEVLAAFAWDQFITHGPGAVIIQRDDLLAGESNAPLPVSYIAAEHIPTGDDFRANLRQYDPHTQIAVLVGQADDHRDQDRLYVLESSGEQRPTPPTCFEQVVQQDDVG